MAHRQVGFDDERRRSSYSTAEVVLRADTYRPNEIRDRGRDRERDYDRDRDRDRDRRDDRRIDSRPERGSPDRRDSLSSGRAREHDSRSRGLPPLDIDAAIMSAPAGPRNSIPLSNGSPVISRNTPSTATNPPPRPGALERSTRSTSAASAVPPSNTSIQMPKAKDPSLQGVMEALFKIFEHVHWRSVLGPERSKKKKEIEKRESEAKKWQSKTEDFPQQRDLIRRARDRDEAEYEKLDQKWKQSEVKFKQHMEGFVAAIVHGLAKQPANATPVGPPFPDPTPSIAALESKFTALQKDLTEAKKGFAEGQVKVQTLESDLHKANEEIQTLQLECKKSNEKAEALKSECRTADDKIRSLEELFKGLPRQEQEVQPIKADLADLKKRVEKFGAEVPRIKEDFTAFQKHVEGLGQDTERKALREATTKMQQNSKSLSEYKTKIEKEMTAIGANVKALEDRTTTSAERAKTKQTADQLLDDSRRYKQRIEELGRRLDIQEDALQQQEGISTLLRSLRARVSTLEDQLAVAQTNAEDAEQIQEVVDQWITLDVKHLIPSHEELLSNLKDEVQLLKDSTSSKEQSRSQVVNDELKQDIQKLRSSVLETRQHVSSISDRMNDVEPSLKGMVLKTMEDGNDAIAGMIDDLSTRMDGVVTRVDTLESKGVQARTPAPTPQLDSRVSPASIELQLADRIKAIEDEKTGTTIRQLGERLDFYIENINQNQTVYDTELQKINNELQEHALARDELRNETRAQQEQQELQMQNLNSHISNLNTSTMAQSIIMHLDSYTARLGPKIDVAIGRLNMIDQQLVSLDQRIDAGLKSQQHPHKRQASPQRSAEDSKKKRKIDQPGGYASSPALPTKRNFPRPYQ
ncbi:hypothetical protein SUNI508_00341 [Seiridium unicorne]|uniref:Uncharacterized protein n=1 Tax=Seiridium unicorne TaxID=138068 RepID=A0ABR2VIT4_9PEZI